MVDRNKERDARLQREYGVSLEERTRLSKFQKDACAICGKLEKDMNISLSVDHRHLDGLLRGLLCMRCNKAIELLNNDPNVAKGAFIYLTKPPFVVLFGERLTAPGRVGTKKRRKLLAKMRIDEKGKSKKKKVITASNKQKSVG